ncbi:MAG: hypothetical protein HY722_12420 [Planctomycetes bacterium]|nr:hypothetical protein [Planctomycetota bacterium]
MPERLFLVDCMAQAYRAHFAFVRSPLTNSRGMNTSALFGFLRELVSLLDEERPDYLGVVSDSPEPTFRHRAYPAY